MELVTGNKGVNKEALHPFGGCGRLLGQYRAIGSALLRVEFRRSVHIFRESVAAIPSEVLESYLDDLLDVSVREETLFIRRSLGWLRAILAPGVGFVVALGTGLYAAAGGASFSVALSLTVCAALPFALMLQYFPKYGLMRRMGFAQIVSSEISRRRGRDRAGSDDSSKIVFTEMWAAQTQRSFQGAARKLYH